MGELKAGKSEIYQAIESLDADRALILKRIDEGEWADYREDLAILERELGQLISKVKEDINKKSD